MEQGFATSELWSVVWHCVAAVLRVGSDRAAGDPPGADRPTAEPDWNLLSPQGRSFRTAGHLLWTPLRILLSDLPVSVPISIWSLRPEGSQGFSLRIAVVLWEREVWAGPCCAPSAAAAQLSWLGRNKKGCLCCRGTSTLSDVTTMSGYWSGLRQGKHRSNPRAALRQYRQAEEWTLLSLP